LYIRIDGGASHRVIEAAFEFEWPNGKKHVLVSNISNGLRNMWTSIYPHNDNEVLIIFEDDMRVSPFFLNWTVHMLIEYGGNQRRPRDPSLIGFSLSPIFLDEISHPFKKWNASKFMPDHEHLYLHTVPSSWGGVYFADRWKEFLLYFRVRIQLPYFNKTEEAHFKILKGARPSTLGDPNLLIPGSRSNVWAKSWKRFLVEYSHGRAMHTLYARIPGRLGLATPLQLSGAHVDGGAVPPDTESRGPSRAMLRNDRVCRLLDDPAAYAALLRAAAAADPARMPLFDLWGRPVGREERAADARRFVDGVLAKNRTAYGPLVRVWRP
jgi:hypothetical protein